MAPRAAERGAISTKVMKRLRWIEAHRRRFAEMNRNRAPLRYGGGATHRYPGRQYRLKVASGVDVGVRLNGGFLHVTCRLGAPDEVAELLNDWRRTRARMPFETRLAKWDRWCVDRRLPVPRLRLLRMLKQWGSAHRDGRIYRNPDLAKAPSGYIEYVLAHEVCHLKHLSHDAKSYRVFGALVPELAEFKARFEQLEI